MSNFAARLVARGAGLPPEPGISLLSPRPVSRFEPGAAIDIETEGYAAADGDSTFEAVAPVFSPMQSRERHVAPPGQPTVGQSESGDRKAHRPGDSPEPARPLPRSAAVGDTGPHQEIQGFRAPAEPAAEHGGPARTAVAGERAVMPTPMRVSPPNLTVPAISAAVPQQQAGHNEHLADPIRPESRNVAAVPPRSSPPSAAFEPERHGGVEHSMASFAAERHTDLRQQAQPAISIGTIEVQFLPREQGVPAPGPQPQRTRGFDAYARARRGQPR